MRGKNKGWTKEMDALVLAGGSVEGMTAQENCNRRYKLKNFYVKGTAYFGNQFYKHLAVLQSVGRAPKMLDDKLMETLSKLLKEVQKV